MKLVKPKFEILEQAPGIDGVYKMVELAGRTCYRSGDKITENSAKEFVDRMIRSGHGAMLEHGTVYLGISDNSDVIDSFFDPKIIPTWTKCHFVSEGKKEWRAITTNLRVLVERFPNDYKGILEKYLCRPTGFHEKRVSVRFTCDRGVSHEFVRHRVFSFAQESTRYCNYSNDKFGNELTFIYPCWFTKYFNDDYSNVDIANWLYSMLYSEKAYFSSILNGMKPQQARAVLPNALKTELVMTGFVSDWEHFFDLRCAPNAPPAGSGAGHTPKRRIY